MRKMRRNVAIMEQSVLTIGCRPAKRVVMSTPSGVIAVDPDQVYTDQLTIDRRKRNGIELRRIYAAPLA